MRKIQSWITSKPIAHRGLHGFNGAIENSLEAFTSAIENNYAIELDVHLLSDGNVVVFHDDDLLRLTGVKGEIKSLTKKNLEWLKLRNSLDQATSSKILLLSEVLSIVNSNVPLLIELKCKHYDGKLEEATLRELKNYKGEFAIQSFNPYSVAHFKRKAPHIMRGLLTYDWVDSDLDDYQKFLLRHLAFLPYCSPDFLAVDWQFLNHYIVRAARKKYPLIAWTVDSSSVFNSIKNDVSNVIFEGEWMKTVVKRL